MSKDSVSRMPVSHEATLRVHENRGTPDLPLRLLFCLGEHRRKQNTQWRKPRGCGGLERKLPQLLLPHRAPRPVRHWGWRAAQQGPESGARPPRAGSQLHRALMYRPGQVPDSSVPQSPHL